MTRRFWTLFVLAVLATPGVIVMVRLLNTLKELAA